MARENESNKVTPLHKNHCGNLKQLLKHVVCFVAHYYGNCVDLLLTSFSMLPLRLSAMWSANRLYNQLQAKHGPQLQHPHQNVFMNHTHHCGGKCNPKAFVFQ